MSRAAEAPPRSRNMRAWPRTARNSQVLAPISRASFTASRKSLSAALASPSRSSQLSAIGDRCGAIHGFLGIEAERVFQGGERLLRPARQGLGLGQPRQAESQAYGRADPPGARAAHQLDAFLHRAAMRPRPAQGSARQIGQVGQTAVIGQLEQLARRRLGGQGILFPDVQGA